MLLRRMADFQPELVQAACARLSASHTDYMRAHQRWQTMLRSPTAPKGLALYEAVLGPADEQAQIAYGDAELTAYSWRPAGLWPQLRWQALVGDRDFVLHGSLVRAPDCPVPQLGEADRPAPWSCVVGDVLTRYPHARQHDPQTPARWAVDVPGPAGAVYQMMFVHGLLQQVTRQTTPTPHRTRPQ
ncbi:hypothetical protein GCM10009662_25520 [Catellatospora coxensis]|uniref:Uncharacterized protein n=2 Tax=Catellatospora coxensis TaxID=310354 RepID=A0A8J3PDU9_9ACTN|nr:hypothetical protein Cco03nite_81710 [Catellatospora coxensis]